MQLITAVIAFLLAIARGILSQKTGRLGLCLGNNRADGSLKDFEDFNADLKAMTNNTAGAVTLVRTFGAGGTPTTTASSILQAAKANGFQVLLGAWTTSNGNDWQNEKAALVAAIPGFEAQVYGITVGSEGLYRGDESGYNSTSLAGWIIDAKATWSNISIGTADTAGSYSGGAADAAVSAGPGLLLASVYPYWVQQPLQNSTANFFDQTLGALSRIQNVSGSPAAIHFMVGETGWPAGGGTNYGDSIAGTANAQTYFDLVVCPALNAGFDVFLFEAFDDPSKQPILESVSGQMEQISDAAWGAMDMSRNYRLNLTCP